ncbi:excinuclease ABC subunit UvrC [Candidatus Dojkabacteria bacterium]|nr:excinuclease ABC subunit UvrC [Candidatus Dojkabacteria bacterium]
MRITKTNLQNLPNQPGCYIYKDTQGKILYIGKAINLKARVNSYFAKNSDERPKIKSMLKKAVELEILLVDSETESLILETSLIKKYKPKYNKLMKDDKSYIWVMFDKKADFPRPEIVREKRIKSAEYFGPFPQSFPAKQVLHELRQLFPYCNTNFKIKHIKTDIGAKQTVKVIGAQERPCLDYYTGFCSGVCAGLISKTEHKRNISHIRKFFRGEKREIYEDLELEMKRAAKAKNFEKAAELRNKLQNLVYVTQRIKVQSRTDEFDLQECATDYLKQTEAELIRRVFGKKTKISKDFRIECYDISNIQGKQAVGSMVLFVNGKSDKSKYRKFKIKSKETPDDFFMMQETLIRRLNRAKKKDQKFLPLPDLIIIDGGKGQLSSSYEILKKFGLEKKIQILGLAKREEELFKILEGKDQQGELYNSFSKTTLPKRSKALYLLQRIRDEAHRFAIGYHRKLREENSIRSSLSDIPGVGALTEKRLIKAFGSMEKIKKAKSEDLQTVVRNKKTVEAIRKLL